MTSTWTPTPAWWPDRLCHLYPHVDFHPISHGSIQQAILEAPAKSVCRRCPVQHDCLDYAITENEQFGIWGGLNPSERDRIRTSYEDR
jgi:WhiB family redox-sensing transcriptional regulator